MPVAEDVKVGPKTKIFHPELVNLYGCEIGPECIIGAFVEIRTGVKIGQKVKIQAGAFIPEGVEIGDEVFIGPNVTFTNDMYPRSTNPDGSLQTASDWERISTKIANKVSIGAGAAIRCGVTIGEGAMVGMGAVVLNDVSPWTLVVGNPAKPIKTLKK